MEIDETPPERLFTVEEANALLPALHEMLMDVNEAHARFLITARELEEIEMRRDRSNVLQLARGLREMRERLGADHAALQAGFARITDQGIQVKGIDPALLDFPAWHDGRIVLLCWHEGEPAITYWHDLDAGFAGRQRL